MWGYVQQKHSWNKFCRQKLFMEYPLSGNVRDLQNTVESMVEALKDENIATVENLLQLDRMKKQQSVLDAERNLAIQSKKVGLYVNESFA